MMTDEVIFQMIWAPKVKQSKRLRLNQADARGLVDEDQINEFGTALYRCCESIIMVMEANQLIQGKPDDVLAFLDHLLRDERCDVSVDIHENER